MNIGTVVNGQLIVDERFLKNADLDTAISAQRNSLTTAIHGEGIEVYEMGEERRLKWEDETEQIRQSFRLVLTKKLTKNRIYEIVNQVRAQPLTFSRYGG